VVISGLPTFVRIFAQPLDWVWGFSQASWRLLPLAKMENQTEAMSCGFSSGRLRGLPSERIVYPGVLAKGAGWKRGRFGQSKGLQ
jgi:hypothetical protein